MKVKVYCKEENKPLYEEMLKRGGFTVSDESNLSLLEDNYAPEYIVGKLSDDNVLVYLNDIILIETFGRDVISKTIKGTFKLKETIENLENLLKPAGFVRISQSSILQKSSIEKISPGLSMRFHLTLKSGIKTDVTRNYYYSFKKFIGL